MECQRQLVISIKVYLSKRRHNCWVLLQLKEFTDKVLFCQTQRLQLTENLLKDLQ